MPQISISQIIRSRRCSISLEISRQGELIVRAPLHVPEGIINRFVMQKEEWILKHLKNKTGRAPAEIKYEEGEEFLYLGKPYQLSVGNFKAISFSDKGNLLFPDFLKFRIKTELNNFYLNKARELITARLKYYADLMGVNYGSVKLSITNSKWGTCMVNNNLQFNWKLIMAPILVIDYVIVHELAHIQEKNHSRNFWKIVERYKPAYRQYRKWLTLNNHRLKI